MALDAGCAMVGTEAGVCTEAGGCCRRLRRSPRASRGVANWLRRAPIANRIWPIALAIALLIGGHRLSAEDLRQPSVIHLSGAGQSLDGDLVLVCPQGGSTEPQFQNQETGRISPILNPRLRAIAEKACQPGLLAAEAGNVNIVNDTGKTIYVGFAPQSGSSITWSADCGKPIRGLTVKIPDRGTCRAAATASVASPGSRFCAATTVGASGLDCSLAQQNNQTLIEPYFQPGPCAGYDTGCIWYDISVIPHNCTDAAWSSNYCAGTGGAAYNLPVRLTCAGRLPEPTYTCKGPPFTSGDYAAAGYPRNCGNPLAACFGDKPRCVNAYFWPMLGIPQPNAVCPDGQTLTITFLSGR